MEIIAGTLDFELNKDTAVAMGKFDGLHLGHGRLMQELLQKKKAGLAVCVFTFDPSPAVFFGLSDGRELSTREEKRRILEKLGVDILVEFPMTKETAGMEPELFVEEILIKRMHTKWIVAGTDVSFGNKGAGNAELLNTLAHKYGYGITTIEKVKYADREISSTLVRELLEQGKMEEVTELLGEPYTICGNVVHGKALGRKLGMPTVNIVPKKTKLLPPCGVYCSSVRWGNRSYAAISNIGYKPTVGEALELGVESHIYDFDKDIYGEEIEVCFYRFLRPEKRFASLEELSEQVAEDILVGKNYQMWKNS